MKKFIPLIISFSIFYLGKAQWNSNTDQNLFITNPNNGASFSKTTNDGKTYIGYWKKIEVPLNYELWLQILDQNGVKQLGNDGIMLSNQIPMIGYTLTERTSVDSQNNLYIGITGTGAGTPGYVFKITPEGNSVWPNGINLGEGYLPTVLPLSNGDIVVGYLPTSKTYMKLQRFNSSGQAVWNNPVKIVSDNPANSTAPANLFELSNNEIEIIFHKITRGTTSYLFAQKIDSDGNLLWANPKQITTQTTTWTELYQGVADGNTVYFGITSGQGGRFDSYLQRIDADGSLPWGETGADFDTNRTYYEKSMKIAFIPGSEHIWAIATYTGGAQGNTGEYIQKFDKNSGTRLLGNNAKEVFPLSEYTLSHEGDLHLINDKPFFAVQKTITPGLTYISLNAVLLDENGDFVWPEKYLPIATFSARKAYTNILTPVNNQSVIVFQEQKTNDSNPYIYAQNFVLSNSDLGVKDINKSESTKIKLYPNPATDVINIGGLDKINFTIYNMAGQMVKSGNTKNGEISVRELIKGEYILKVTGQKNGMKFIKK